MEGLPFQQIEVSTKSYSLLGIVFYLLPFEPQAEKYISWVDFVREKSNS